MRGLGYGILGALSATFMSRIIHQASATYSIYELAWIRNSTIAVGLLPWVVKNLPVLRTPEGRLLWIRGALGAGGVLLYFHLLKITHVSEALFLSNITPLLTLGLGMFALQERPTARQWLGTALMLGALTLHTLPAGSGATFYVLFWAVLMAVVQSFAFISVKKSAGRFPALLIVFMFCLVSLFVTPLFNLRWESVTMAYGSGTMWLFILLGLGTQVFVTKSFESLTAGQATLVGQVAIIFAALAEVSLGERRLTGLDILSTGILFIGLYLVCVAPSLQSGLRTLANRWGESSETTLD